MPAAAPLRLAVDATPLLGRRTGVGAFVAAVLPRLAGRADLAVTGYALSLRGGRDLPAALPPGVAARVRPGPASALLRVWARAEVPPGRWWTGPAAVVHGTNFVVPPSRPAAEVVTVHDLTPLRFPALASPATRAFPALVRRAVRRGAWVHTPSAFVAAEVVDAFGVPAERVRAVWHGVDPPGLPDASPVAGPYVLALGTVEPRKDLPSLVRAFDQIAGTHADLRLVIAGPDGWGAAELGRAIDAAAHRSRVLRLGWVGAADRDALLAGARVCAYPSRYEGFGLPVLEAMARGVPVVTTSAGSLPEVAGDAALVVEPADVEALAGALDRCVADDALHGRLASAGAARAAGFRWDDTAAGLAGLYRDAAG